MWKLAFAALLLGGPAVAEAPKKSKSPETLDSILNNANESDVPPARAASNETAPADSKPKNPPAAKPATERAAPKSEPSAPPTDDNDGTAEAARPAALEPVALSGKSRTAGAYEMGELDCRMLDGAGIERVLPKRLVAGEEPDLLCRILITQPPTVAASAHTLTVTAFLGAKPTYQQTRQVRISAVGRRALVFVIPADRIASEEPVRVTLRAQLSGRAKPPLREIKFTVEPQD